MPPGSSSQVQQVDLRDPHYHDLASRIGTAWVSIRRGASATVLRDWMFGTGADALEQGQMDTLDLLAHRPHWRMSDLAEALRVDPSTATRAVQRLVSVGLAERRPSEADGRVVHVVITNAGRARHQVARHRRQQLMAHLLGSFPDDRRDQVAELFELWVAAIDDFVANLDSPDNPDNPESAG